MSRNRRYNDIYDDEYEDEGVPPQEDLYADYYGRADDEPYSRGGEHLTPEERERYYAERDAYYARRDAYYAERDAYYASHPEDEYEDEEDWDDAPPRRASRRTDRWDYVPEEERSAGRRGRRTSRRRRRKGWLFRRILFFLLAGVLVLLLIGQPPVRNPGNQIRAAGHSTILLAGTDESGDRTDTIMLLSLDRTEGQLRLLSIPRDTYAPGYGGYKINAAYGAAGGGAAGMEELMGAVERTIGFAPDGYLLVDLDAFVETVDLLGGLDFNVPVDMLYDDDTQNLHIDLRAGEQHLNGEQVMGMVRFRAGYANADIGRTEVQRDFLKAALRQWLRFSNLKKLPELWRIYRENMVSDLRWRNFLWITRVLVKAQRSDMSADVLPGWADMVDGSSVYMIDPPAAAAVLAQYSPYQ